MQILKLHLRPMESKLGLEPSNLYFKKPSRWFWFTLKFENRCFIVQTLDHAVSLKDLGIIKVKLSHKQKGTISKSEMTFLTLNS